MEIKWLGAILVLVGCGGFGMSIGAGYRKQERVITGLIKALNLMESELEYRLTPLPELLVMAGEEAESTIKDIFRSVAASLEEKNYSDPGSAMLDVLAVSSVPYPYIRRLLKDLGNSLGKFDLPGQIRGIAYVKKECAERLELLKSGRAEQLKSYQTLSICAGAALIILFY